MDKFAGQTSGWDQHISMGPGYSCSKKEKTWSYGLIINFIECSSFHIFYGTSIFLGTSVFPWDQYTSMGPAYFHGTSILLWDQYTSLGPVFYNRTVPNPISPHTSGHSRFFPFCEIPYTGASGADRLCVDNTGTEKEG